MMKRYEVDPTLHMFLSIIVETAHRRAAAIKHIKEIANEGTDKEIEAYLYGLQVRAIGTALSLIDGSIGPTEWDGVRLVNAKTGAKLYEDIRMEFAGAEMEYYDLHADPFDNDAASE
jgi:hypothetical protein